MTSKGGERSNFLRNYPLSSSPLHNGPTSIGLINPFLPHPVQIRGGLKPIFQDSTTRSDCEQQSLENVGEILICKNLQATNISIMVSQHTLQNRINMHTTLAISRFFHHNRHPISYKKKKKKKTYTRSMLSSVAVPMTIIRLPHLPRKTSRTHNRLLILALPSL